MTDNVQFRVKFVNDDRDLLVEVPRASTCSAVVAQIRSHKGWEASKHVRLVCTGRELYADDPVSKAAGAVLHCIAVEVAAGCQPPRKPLHAQDAQLDAAQADWLEVVDPGTVLMWIFGSILALLWLLFVFYAHMFDKTSVVMLCMMTIAFLIPCVLSYMPCLPLSHNASRGLAAAQTQQGYAGYATTAGRALPGPQPWLYSTAVPPRPRARPPPQVQQ